jgi:hypothetical protein
MVSRDVIFDEESVRNWSDEDKAKEQVLEEPKELSTKAPPSTPTIFSAYHTVHST